LSIEAIEIGGGDLGDLQGSEQGTIGSSMYIRVVSTVLGEKLGLVKSSHSRQSSATVPFPADTTGRRSTSATMDANTLDASRLLPRTVRSTEILRPVSASRPA
jgi:hypothetical protein